MTSNLARFTITPFSSISPVITSISPTTVQEGSSSFDLTVFGSNFVAGAMVQWTAANGAITTLIPFSISSGQLVVVVPSSLLTVGTAGTASVAITQVVNGSTVTSNSVSFTITPSSQVPPVISSLSPGSVLSGSGSFTLTVNGSGFVPGAMVQWTTNGVTMPLVTTFLNSTQLQAAIPSSLLTAAGTAAVTVTQVINGITVTSNAVSFTISSVSPTLIVMGLNITATVNVAQDFTVALFTDTSPNAQPGAYAVPVNFGDGTPVQAGTVTQPGGPGTPFLVNATHTYTETGTFTVQVQVFKEIGGFGEAMSTATVTGAGGGGAASVVGNNPLVLRTLGPGATRTVVPSAVSTTPLQKGAARWQKRKCAACWIRAGCRRECSFLPAH
jgi:hypothetical protein